MARPAFIFGVGAARLFDIRAGEARSALVGFAALQMLVIGAHTVMETARDALLLTGPGPKALGFVYMAIAVCTVPCAAVAARSARRFGPRRTLAGTLAIAVLAPALLFCLPPSHGAAIATYVASGVLGSIVVPQFWGLAGTVFTTSQGRRLFGLIAAAGIVGGVLGPALASVSLFVMPAKGLLLVSSGVFVLAATVLRFVRGAERAVRSQPRPGRVAAVALLRGQPFLLRIALVVFLSTATFLSLDYMFKSAIAQALPPASIAPFVARYYLALNLASLVVQLFVSGPLVRGLGFVAAIVFTPLLLFGGATATLVAGASLVAVLSVKAVDGALRNSLHRITQELAYLPLPTAARIRAKPFIDGALTRAAQTLTGAALLAIGASAKVSTTMLAGIVALLALAWLASAVTMRRPYLALLRQAISSGALNPQDSPDPIDLETAEVLVQRLGSDDPIDVLGAMTALTRRGRAGLVPALVLLHGDDGVLVQALETFGGSSRTDWFLLGKRLLGDEREGVRLAAARALARHDQLDPSTLANDVGARARGYAAVRLAIKEGARDVLQSDRIAALLREPGERLRSAQAGMLEAIADARPSKVLSPLLLRLASDPFVAQKYTELIARAATNQGDAKAIPLLVAMLAHRDGREAVRAALVHFGDRALDEVDAVLVDAAAPRRLRLHVPKTLARFGSRRAAERLLRNVETERDGLVRYKSIRALGVLATEHRVPIDRARAERLARTDLARHFHVVELRAALASAPGGSTGASVAGKLLLGLLDDKIRQSLDRAFRLLQLAYPREDVHRVHLASISRDPYARANAGELLDALLRRAHDRRLRELFDLVVDDLPPPERARRARAIIAAEPVATPDAAIAALLRETDTTLAALAGVWAVEVNTGPMRAALAEARRTRPEVGALPLFARWAQTPEGHHV